MKKRGEIALKRTRGLFRLLFHGFHDPFRARLTTRRTLQGFYIRLNNRTGNLHRWNISCTLNRADRAIPTFSSRCIPLISSAPLLLLFVAPPLCLVAIPTFSLTVFGMCMCVCARYFCARPFFNRN